jgi:excisionase family DNA binding protein
MVMSLPADALAGYLSTSQAARRLGVSKNALLGWVRRGRLGALRTPLGLLIPAAEVERLAPELERRRAPRPPLPPARLPAWSDIPADPEARRRWLYAYLAELRRTERFTPAEVSVLAALYVLAEGPRLRMRIADLAAQAQLNPKYCARILRALEQRGLLRRVGGRGRGHPLEVAVAAEGLPES